MSKDIRDFLVISSERRWGKGSSPSEAAKNAGIKGKWVEAVLYERNNLIDGELNCDNMGGVSFNWSPEFFPVLKENRFLRSIAVGSIKVFIGEMRISKGKLSVKKELD